MSQNKQTISLIGAGLVGSLLAVLLAKRGYRVEIFERRPDMRENSISAGRSINLALANRGIYPLQKAGLMQQIEKILTPMRGRMVHDVQGEQNFQSYGQREEEVIYSVSRSDLNKICMTAAEQTGLVKIHFNKNCQAVDFENNKITLKDEQSGKILQHKFTRVIGTDGSASAVREAIHKKHSEQHAVLPLGHSYKELCIPAGKNNQFQIDENSLHIWPRGGYMLIALPNQDASFTVTLFLPNEGDISFKTLDTAEKIEAFFKHQFNDAYQLMPNLLEDFFANPTGNLATVKCSPWHHTHKALLLGDAAHAIVPFHGQGMNCGFEDALYLAETIDELNQQDSIQEWQSIFAQVDKQRKANADAIADMAIENYITMRDSVRDEKFILANKLAFELEKRFPDYFCPRYSMVMFHRLPYEQAYKRGKIQQQILQQLIEQAQHIEQVDFDLAQALIEKQLTRVELNPR